MKGGSRAAGVGPGCGERDRAHLLCGTSQLPVVVLVALTAQELHRPR